MPWVVERQPRTPARSGKIAAWRSGWCGLHPFISGRIITAQAVRHASAYPVPREHMSYIKRFAVTGSVCPSTPIFGQRAAAEVARLAPHFDRVVVAGIGSGVV